MNGLQEGYSDEHADAAYHQHYQHHAGHELQHEVDVDNVHEEDVEDLEGDYEQDEGEGEMIVEEEEEMQGATSSFSNVAQGLEGKHRDNMLQYWQETINSIEHEDHKFKIHQLPLARIKKVMKADEDVRMISAEAPILFAKGCDIFITELTMRAWIHAEESKRRTLQRSDIANALQKSDMFDFLIDIVPREEAMNSRRTQQYEEEAAVAAATAATRTGGEDEELENGHEHDGQEDEHEEKHDAEERAHQEELSAEQDHAGHDVAPGTTNSSGQEYVYQYADLDYNEGYRQY